MILIILGTRADIIKLSTLLDRLKARNIPFKIIHTGQHDTLELMQKLKLPRPDYYLGRSLRNIWSKSRFPWFYALFWSLGAFQKIRMIIRRQNPDFIVYHGNTMTSSLACFSAKSILNLKSRLVHVESGVRGNTKDSRIPDFFYYIGEKCGDILLAQNNVCFDFLKRKYKKKRVLLVGDIQEEVVTRILKFSDKKPGKKNFILINAVRSLNTKQKIREFYRTIKNIDENLIISLNPKIRNNLINAKYFEKIIQINNVKIINPPDFPEFISLLKDSSIVLTDSNGVQTEASALNIPCIVLNDFSPYKESEYRGIRMVTGVNKARILKALENICFKKEIKKKYLSKGTKVTDKIINIMHGS
ncbi:MAG: UDP-N-acetylglucosamine 2-epimerase [Candidatus Woesearchaeota archaeon]